MLTVCSLASEKAPNDLCLQVSIPCVAPLHWIRAGLCEDWSMVEMTTGDFQGYVKTKTNTLPLPPGFLLGDPLWGNQLPCLGDVKAAYGNIRVVKNSGLLPTVRISLLAGHMSETPCEWLFQPKSCVLKTEPWPAS